MQSNLSLSLSLSLSVRFAAATRSVANYFAGDRIDFDTRHAELLSLSLSLARALCVSESPGPETLYRRARDGTVVN